MKFDFLIASKDKKMISKIEQSLSEHQVHFHSISNGNDLIITIFDYNYDLLILDNHLDEMMGIDALPIIKKVRPQLPVIYLGDQDEYQSSKKVASSGVLARLIKSNDVGNNSYLQHIKDIVIRYISKDWSDRSGLFKDE